MIALEKIHNKYGMYYQYIMQKNSRMLDTSNKIIISRNNNKKETQERKKETQKENQKGKGKRR